MNKMSSDLTKCSGLECPIKESCFRFTSQAEPLYQSYFVEIPGKWEDDTEPINSGCEKVVKNWKCDMYWGQQNENIVNYIQEIMK